MKKFKSFKKAKAEFFAQCPKEVDQLNTGQLDSVQGCTEYSVKTEYFEDEDTRNDGVSFSNGGYFRGWLFAGNKQLAYFYQEIRGGVGI